MKIEVYTRDLKNALIKLENIRKLKGETGFHNNKDIKLKIENRKMILTASNSGVVIQSTINYFGTDIENTELTITNVQNINKALKSFKNDLTAIEINDYDITIANGNKSILNKKETEEEFVLNNELQSTNIINTYIFTESVLYKNLNKLNNFTAKDNIKPNLKGINFQGHYITALDGYSLGTIFINEYIKENFVIYLEATATLLKILDKKSDKKVEMIVLKNNINDTIIKFKFNNLELTTKTYYGDYIKEKDIQGFFSQEDLIELKIDKNNFMSNIKYLSQFSIKTPVSMDITDEEIHMRKKNPEGEINTNNKIEILKKKKDFKIGFNTKYFLNVLKAIDSERITIKMNSPLNPIIVKSDDDGYSNEKYLLLPVRLKQQS